MSYAQVKRDFAHRLAASTHGTALSLVRPAFSTAKADAAAYPAASTVVPSSLHAVSASVSAKSESADDVADNRLGGRTLQMLLNSLGEDARKFYELDDATTPERLRQSPNLSPFVPSSAEQVHAGASAQAQLTPSTMITHPGSVTALTPAQSFFRGERENSASNSNNALALTASDRETGFLGISSSSAPYLDAEQMLVLEVCDEAGMSKYVYEAAMAKGVHQQLLLDARWTLVCGIQCSYVGQLMNYLEQLASLNANGTTQENAAGNKAVRIGKNTISAQSLQALQGGNAAAWENCLRNVADGVALLWSCDNLCPKMCSVPFIVRALKLKPFETSAGPGYTGSEDDNLMSSKLFQWLAMAERAPEMVSEWSLFAVFVEEACAQVQRVMDTLFVTPANDTSDTRVLNNAAVLLSDPAILSLTLQLFHSTGKKSVVYVGIIP